MVTSQLEKFPSDSRGQTTERLPVSPTPALHSCALGEALPQTPVGGGGKLLACGSCSCWRRGPGPHTRGPTSPCTPRCCSHSAIRMTPGRCQGQRPKIHTADRSLRRPLGTAARPRRKWQPQETLRSANQKCTKLAGLPATNTQVTKKWRQELLKGGHGIMRMLWKNTTGRRKSKL